MRVKRRGGELRVDLMPAEVQLLGVLFDDLEALITAGDRDDPVRRRLFPAGYADDEDAAREFAELVESDLAQARSGRLQSCRAELPADGGRMTLDSEAADRWIRVLNDLRLAIGTRLGVTEDEELDPADEASALYHWLSAAQEILVGHLMR